MKFKEIIKTLQKTIEENTKEVTPMKEVQEKVIDPIKDETIEVSKEETINQILEILSKCSPDIIKDIIAKLNKEEVISSDILVELAVQAADSEEIPDAVAFDIAKQLPDEETIGILQDADLQAEYRLKIIDTINDNKKKEDETCTELKMVYGAMKDFEHQSEFIERIQKIIGISNRTEKINEGLYKCIAKNSALMYKKTNGAINLYAMEQLIPINEMIKVKMPERIEREYSELLEEGEENKFDLKDVKERFIDKMVKELHRKAKEEEQPDSTFMKYLGDIDEEQSKTLIKCFKKYNPDIKKREMAKILRIAKGEENEYIYESKKNIKTHGTIDDEDIEIIRMCMDLGLFETLRNIPSDERAKGIEIINGSLNKRLNKQKRLQAIQNAKVAKKEDIPEVKKAKIDKGFDR